MRRALARRVVEPDQPRRGRRGLADAEDAAEALGGEPLLVPDRDVEAGLAGRARRACSASHAGFFRLDGTVASIRARQPAPPIATAAVERGPVVGVGQAGQHDPAHRHVLGARRAPVEGEGAQHRADDERLEADRGASAGIVVATRPRSGRRGPARHRRGGSPRRAARRAPTSSTKRRRVLGAAQRDRQDVDLAGRRRWPGRLEQARAGRAPSSVGEPRRRRDRAPGVAVGPVPGTGSAEHLDPGEGVGRGRAEREVGR